MSAPAEIKPRDFFVIISDNERFPANDMAELSKLLCEFEDGATVWHAEPYDETLKNITEDLAWEWANEHGPYDPVPAIFERWIGDEMQERRDAAEDPDARHDAADQRLHMEREARL